MTGHLEEAVTWIAIALIANDQSAEVTLPIGGEVDIPAAFVRSRSVLGLIVGPYATRPVRIDQVAVETLQAIE